tara:strand:- start:416 stop:1471 length:1056 start_codon:yes stop_codon:yes gene_type:complete
MSLFGIARKKGLDRSKLGEEKSKKIESIDSDEESAGFTEEAIKARRRVVEGIACETMVEPVPQFDRAPCETVIAGRNNAWITLGRDRPGNRLTGYGGAGHSHCGTIDLVVGRGSSKANGLFGASGAGDDDVLGNSAFNDAARIYISQKTDPDKNFGLSPGTQGNRQGESAVIVKADQVRLVGRGGMKLITGQAKNVEAGPGGEKMSHGTKQIRPSPKIELIAGNQNGFTRHFSLNRGFFTVKRIQPTVLGDNMVEALEELIDLVNQLQAATANFAIEQSIYNGAIASHGHPFFMTPAPQLVGLGINNMIKMVTDVHMPLFGQKVNTMFYELNYLQPFGMRYINSSSIMIST